ncbi:MAG: hypothetical protein OXG04_10875 [Acidobacteria bacterium]|nr:hypothetical protein [Acidobacteriota bacterium]
MRMSGIAKSQNACARAKAALRAARGVDAAVRRAHEIAARKSKLWRGRLVSPVRCTGASGKGPHQMHVEAAVLWSLIDLETFRCPHHANDPRREDETSTARDEETPS